MSKKNLSDISEPHCIEKTQALMLQVSYWDWKRIPKHSSFEREKPVNEFPQGLWTWFWDYGWLLSWPRWKFFPESIRTRWRCDHFSKKWSKSKSDATLSIKKPFVTPNFCGRNFSTMHHFWVWIFLSLKIDECLV